MITLSNNTSKQRSIRYVQVLFQQNVMVWCVHVNGESKDCVGVKVWHTVL